MRENHARRFKTGPMPTGLICLPYHLFTQVFSTRNHLNRKYILIYFTTTVSKSKKRTPIKKQTTISTRTALTVSTICTHGFIRYHTMFEWHDDLHFLANVLEISTSRRCVPQNDISHIFATILVRTNNQTYQFGGSPRIELKWKRKEHSATFGGLCTGSMSQ